MTNTASAPGFDWNPIDRRYEVSGPDGRVLFAGPIWECEEFLDRAEQHSNWGGMTERRTMRLARTALYAVAIAVVVSLVLIPLVKRALWGNLTPLQAIEGYDANGNVIWKPVKQ